MSESIEVLVTEKNGSKCSKLQKGTNKVRIIPSHVFNQGTKIDKVGESNRKNHLGVQVGGGLL